MFTQIQKITYDVCLYIAHVHMHAHIQVYMYALMHTCTHTPGNNLSGIASHFAIQISHSCDAFLLATAIICDAF